MVGMAEIKIARSPDEVLVGLGLGSCIGVCVYDRHTRIAGMAHVVLPESMAKGEDSPGKYADTALPALIAEMQKNGASLRHVTVAIAGGAQLFSFAGGAQRMDIGKRNGAAVLQALQKYGLTPVAEDLGGNAGRTVQLFAADGRVRVKTIGRGELDLTLLSQSAFATLPKAA